MASNSSLLFSGQSFGSHSSSLSLSLETSLSQINNTNTEKESLIQSINVLNQQIETCQNNLTTSKNEYLLLKEESNKQINNKGNPLFQIFEFIIYFG